MNNNVNTNKEDLFKKIVNVIIKESRYVESEKIEPNQHVDPLIRNILNNHLTQS